MAIYIAAVTIIWPSASGRQALGIGAAWLILTLAFEFLLGRFVSGLSWPDAGRIAVAPYLFFRLQRRR